MSSISAIMPVKRLAIRGLMLVGLGAVFAIQGLDVACADTSLPSPDKIAPLPANAARDIRDQLQTDVDAVNSKKLDKAARDEALAVAVTQVMMKTEQTYGAGFAPEAASVILASTTVPAYDIGKGLGLAAIKLAPNNFEVASATAQTIANEGDNAAVNGCAHSDGESRNPDTSIGSADSASGDAIEVGNTIAKICRGAPVVAAMARPADDNVGIGAFNVVPPPPPLNPSPN